MEPLTVGNYTISVVGKTFTFEDTFQIPTHAPDSIFQFRITVVNKNTGKTVPDLPVRLFIFNPIDTSIIDTTDSTGYVEFNVTASTAESLLYELDEPAYSFFDIYFAQTWAKQGIPEVIKVAVIEH